MANPMWVAGTSGNPTGRTRGSIRQPRKRLEAFYYGYFTRPQLKKILDALPAKDKAEFFIAMTPFVVAKPNPDGISQEEVEKLYDLITESAKEKKHAI